MTALKRHKGRKRHAAGATARKCVPGPLKRSPRWLEEPADLNGVTAHVLLISNILAKPVVDAVPKRQTWKQHSVTALRR
jgi:hypothetical protein